MTTKVGGADMRRGFCYRQTGELRCSLASAERIIGRLRRISELGGFFMNDSFPSGENGAYRPHQRRGIGQRR